MFAGNTIEGGLMEIKTPYRIPYVSQMAALDGVSYTGISHLWDLCVLLSQRIWGERRERPVSWTSRSLSGITRREAALRKSIDAVRDPANQ